MPHRSSTSPEGVSSAPCGERSSRRAPRAPSRSEIVLETAGWEILSLAAALAMLPLSATAIRTRRSRRVIRRPRRSDHSIGLNHKVTAVPRFSVYQIMAAPTRVRAFRTGAIPHRTSEAHMITKRQWLSLAGAGGLASIMPNGARAQLGQAAKHLMVGFGAGGAIDVVGRMLAGGL